jgi:hypothetical protein
LNPPPGILLVPVNQSVSRRSFLTTAAAVSSAIITAPTVLTAQKTDGETIIGEGEYKYI